MTDQTSQQAAVSDRKAAEQEYSISAFDYVRNPVGSRDWCLYWDGWQAAWSRAAKPAVPEVLFDGYAVLQAMSEKAKVRTSPENVSVVLDAAVKLIRAAAPPLPVAQGAALTDIAAPKEPT
jgi:hypothetical protein